MWARNLLFVGVSLAGLVAIGNQLLRRDRVDRPADSEPGRFAAAITPASSASAETTSSGPPSRRLAISAPTLTKLNAEFRSTGKTRGSKSPRGPTI